MKTIQTLFILAAISTNAFAQTGGRLLGFADKSSADQRSLEAKFDSHLKADNLRDWMKRLTARPHHLGSAYNKENADFIASLFRSFVPFSGYLLCPMC
jgi:N-acetylated-alpha-linked acidic dipeptidase